MNDYSFAQLNDNEFEALSIDLLSKKFDCSIERFKAGQDQGIDGRFFTNNSAVIIQCKHYLKSGVSSLISKLKASELPKIQRLNPHRYIVVTSCQLSPDNKAKIKEILEPFILCESDIFGAEDLNNLLKNYHDIERQYYKLWLSSTNVLDTILNNAILGRSSDYLQNTIVSKAHLLIQTDNFEKALIQIENNHTLIITGAPGVGKTTLANQLSLYLCIENEYEFYCIDEDLKEAEEIYQNDKKQLFYFDDFLGANILEALGKPHRDSKIIQFIRRVKNDPNKRFILTSRSHILNRKSFQDERYKQAKINQDRYELEITQLSFLEKAKILYNHLWHSNMPQVFIDELYRNSRNSNSHNKRYEELIFHRNYNPRLIEFITDYDHFKNIELDKYWKYILGTLNNPKDVWKQVIEHDLDELSKYILLAVTLHGNSISEKGLRLFYDLLLEKNQNLHNGKTFTDTIKVLLDSLLSSTLSANQEKNYTLFNPSIADYFIENYLSEFLYIEKINLYLDSYKYSQYLLDLHKNNKILNPEYSRLIQSKISLFIQQKKHCPDDLEIAYLIHHWEHINFQNQDIKEYLVNLGKVTLLSMGNYDTSRLFGIIPKLINKGFICPQESHHQLIDFISFYLLPEQLIDPNFFGLASVINLLSSEKNKFIELFSIEFTNYQIDNDLITGCILGEHYLSSIDVDNCCVNDVEKLIIDSLNHRYLSNIPFELPDEYFNTLISSIDVDYCIEDEKENRISTQHMEDFHDKQPYISSLKLQQAEITDLFQNGENP